MTGKEPKHKGAVALVQTVQGNYEGYTKREVLKAKEACMAQAMMGNPSKKDYKTVVSNNLIPKCPIMPTDIANARAIFGPDLPSVKAKQYGQGLHQWWGTTWRYRKA